MDQWMKVWELIEELQGLVARQPSLLDALVSLPERYATAVEVVKSEHGTREVEIR